VPECRTPPAAWLAGVTAHSRGACVGYQQHSVASPLQSLKHLRRARLGAHRISVMTFASEPDAPWLSVTVTRIVRVVRILCRYAPS